MHGMAIKGVKNFVKDVFFALFWIDCYMENLVCPANNRLFHAVIFHTIIYQARLIIFNKTIQRYGSSFD